MENYNYINELNLYVFNRFDFGEIRVKRDSETGEIWLCLRDICKCLGIQVKHVTPRLTGEVVTTDLIPDSLGRCQETYFVNEEGFYDVVFDSRKPVAKEFRKWIAKVIKSVNQTGAYVEPDQIEIKFNEYNNN